MTATEPPAVLTLFLDPELQRTAFDLCALAGCKPRSLDPEQDFAPQPMDSEQVLVLVEAGIELPEGLSGMRRIRISSSSDAPRDGTSHVDLELPGDGALLIGVVRDWMNAADEGSDVILVGAWHGGGGATSAAIGLARASRGIVLDASGNVSFPPISLDESFGWDQVDPQDLPSGSSLVAAMPRLSGVPVLTSVRGAVGPRDPRVMAVMGRSPRRTVVDCGTDLIGLAELWDLLLEAGERVQVVLVGRTGDAHASSAARALALLSCEGESEELIALGVGSVSSLFKIVQHRFGSSWHKAPRPSSNRGWSRLAAAL